MAEYVTPEAHYHNQSAHALRPSDIQPMLKDYKAPKVRFGMQVTWYPRKSQRNRPSLGVVARVGDPHIDVLVVTEAAPYKESVLHVSDPRLRLENSDEDGCWDFTEETRWLAKWIRQTESRVADLERHLKKD